MARIFSLNITGFLVLYLKNNKGYSFYFQPLLNTVFSSGLVEAYAENFTCFLIVSKVEFLKRKKG